MAAELCMSENYLLKNALPLDPLWTSSVPGNAQRTLAIFTPLAAFIRKTGTSGRGPSPAATAPATATILRYIDKIQTITAIGEHRAQAGRIACNHGGN